MVVKETRKAYKILNEKYYQRSRLRNRWEDYTNIRRN